MSVAGARARTSLIKPHFKNLAGSGTLLDGFVSEVDVEDPAVSSTVPYRLAAPRHILILKAGSSEPAQLEWTSNGRRRASNFYPGDFILNPAGLVTMPRWNCPVKLRLLAIESEEVERYALQAANRPGTEIVPAFGFRDELLANLMLAVTREFECGTPDLMYAETIASAVLAHLVRIRSTIPSSKGQIRNGLSSRILREATEYMRTHLGQRITLRELAAIAGVSPSHFVRLFRQSAGVPPHQRLLQLRLEKAETLLRNSRLAIAEVAAETGFSDQSHLTRMFRRQRGITPLTFRRS